MVFGNKQDIIQLTPYVLLVAAFATFLFFRRPLGADAHTYKLQIEGFAATILEGAPQHGANVEEGVGAMRALAAIALSAETGEKVGTGNP